jgi:hypothetical protein
MTREIPDDIAKAMADSMRDVVQRRLASKGENFDKWIDLLDPKPARPSLENGVAEIIREARTSGYSSVFPRHNALTIGDVLDSRRALALIRAEIKRIPLVRPSSEGPWRDPLVVYQDAVLALFPEATS